MTRERVVEAAMTMIEEGRYREMSIRNLAAELGVAPMTLYGHIKNRDDLLDAVVDRLLDKGWEPEVSTDDWRAWVIDATLRFHDLLATEPAALHIYLTRPVTAPTALRRMFATIDALKGAGLGPDECTNAYATIHTYTIGFAALETSRRQGLANAPELTAVAESLAAFTSHQQFQFGLALILDGLGARPST